ncbi:MAG: radical SAM protein [Polyangiaceae bacterium]|nr:radical SAM protein [Polyangiaceae bacterium]MCW5790211.1 radical SAM protein [Polyangiaceae bacterium]
MASNATLKLIRQRLADEVGRIPKQAPIRVGLCYPSPYHVGMSSLGFQRIYRLLQETPDMMCERLFLPDGGDRAGLTGIEPVVSYEGLRGLSDFPILAFSVAYELELAGLVRMLDAAKIPIFWRDRNDRDPFVLCGGPLTFSNPCPLLPFADAVVMGEAEEIVPWAIETIAGASSHREARARLAEHPSITVGEHHGEALRKIAACSNELLPAHSAIRTPHTELSNMFLIETERGCSRSCQYCVMRRSTNGGMRLVPQETILSTIPEDARRVGLVGAAVSDHPRIIDIVNTLADRGAEVGLSSLRPDRLKEEFVAALRRVGYRTLTTALDGASERLRDMIERRGRERHYEYAAERARRYGYDRLKLYLILGLPTETDADIDECVAFVTELSRQIPIALGIAPLCPKRNTPLDGVPFAGVDVVAARLERLRAGLRGRADVRSTSPKWAWVESVLAQNGAEEGEALARAVRAGGRYSDYRKEFGALGHLPNPKRQKALRRLTLAP